MRFISHRGNLSGRNEDLENSPGYIEEALKKGFDVEIDMRIHLGELYLGHDSHQYKINDDWLSRHSSNLWIHCKDGDSLDHCMNMGYHCFFHNIDAYTITSRGFVWAYPGMPISSRLCISVMPERKEGVVGLMVRNYYGVCSDFVKDIEETYEQRHTT